MWSATVTAAKLGDKRHGYSAFEGDEGGSISNDNFTYRDGQFTILRVRSADEWGDEALVIDVSNDSTGGHHLSWTIIVNDRKGENLSTARRHYATYTRHRRNNVGAHWHDGQKLAVAVRMNDTGAYGKPTVCGTPKVGMRLTADRTTIIDPNDLPNSLQDFNHQWMRSTGGPLPHVPGASRHWLDSRERPHVDHTRRHRPDPHPHGRRLRQNDQGGVSYTDSDGFLQGAVYSEATAEVANPTAQEAQSLDDPNTLPAPDDLHSPSSTQDTITLSWFSIGNAGEYKLLRKRTEPTNGSAYRAHSTTCRAERRANSGPPNWTKSRTFVIRFALAS